MAELTNPYTPVTVADDIDQPTDIKELLQRQEDQISALTSKISELESTPACPIQVNQLYLSLSSANPATIWPGTTWQQYTGRFIRMANDVKTGGADTVTLNVNQIPSHNHSTRLLTDNLGSDANLSMGQHCYALNMTQPSTYTGGSQAHNNMPAYQDVYAWKRTA